MMYQLTTTFRTPFSNEISRLESKTVYLAPSPDYQLMPDYELMEEEVHAFVLLHPKHNPEIEWLSPLRALITLYLESGEPTDFVTLELLA